MITKELLDRLHDLSHEADELRGMIRAFRYGLDLKASDGTPKGSAKPGDPTGKKAADKVSLEQRWQEKIDEIERIGGVVEDALPMLDSFDRRIIRLYYFQGMEDRRIGNYIGMTREAICRRRMKAIDVLTGEVK